MTDSFVRDLETLEVSRELLLSGSIAKARMALILLDSLVDALLHRRLVLMYEAERSNWIMDPPRFPKSVRLTARKSFDERLRIVQQPSWLPWTGSSEVLLTDLEPVVLSVGHSYRNAAYHRDTHNPKVVTPLTKVFYEAVAAAFSRSHDHGLVIGTLSGELPDARVRLGIEKSGGLGLTHRDAAAAARAKLTEGLDVPLEELRAHLADDLRSRVGKVEEDIDFLPFEEPEFETLLGEAQFWDKHGADDELMRLDDEWNPALRRIRDQELPTQEEVDAAIEKFHRRVLELKRTAGSPTVSLADLAAALQQADVVAHADDLAVVLNVYKDADRSISALEKYIGEAAEEYDRAIQLQIDIERGK